MVTPPPALTDTTVLASGPAMRLVVRALAEMAGPGRSLLYDVPREQAPRAIGDARVFVRGSAGWRRYLATRARFDDGALTLLLALRRLGRSERRLAVDWGARHGNTFILVEPLDERFDLTDPTNSHRHTLEELAAALLPRRDAASTPPLPWTRETPLGAAVRAAYGIWIAWPEPYRDALGEPVALPSGAPHDSLQDRVLGELRARYPQAAFDDALAALYERERELFGGHVARTRIPFLTRLGLPVLYEPRCVDHALRRLVNEGHAWVFEDGPDPAFYRGPQRPVAERITDAEFERLRVR